MQTTTLPLGNWLYPAQPPVPLGDTSEAFTEPNATVYNASDPYKVQIVEVINHGFYDGNNKIVTLAVYPFRYLPIADELTFYENMSITLNFEDAAKAPRNVSSRASRYNEIYGQMLTNMVDNPEDISAYKGATPPAKSSYSHPYYEYIIITSSDLEAAFDEFIAWKAHKGINIGVVTMDYIRSNYNGDNISGIYDDAGKVRQFLADAYSNGAVWALLAGDHTKVPIRYGYTKDTLNSDHTIIPTDLYFAEFNGDWNVDGDTNYGEPADDVEYETEIFAGRLLCTNSAQIQGWANKVKNYEYYPGNGDFSYLKRSLFIQSDQMQRDQHAQQAINHYPDNFSALIIEEEPSYDAENPTGPTGAEVITEMNNHHGVISWMGHGKPIGMAVMTSGVNGWEEDSKYGFCSEDDSDYENYAQIEESGNGLDNLTNIQPPDIL